VRKVLRKRAFVLLSTMFFVVVLGLVLRAAIIRMPSALGTRQSLQAKDLALQAAHSGLDYAVSQLRENPNWRGQGKGTVVINQPGIKVTEDGGLVVGEFQGANGSRSSFRIRFEPEDPDTAPPREEGDTLFDSINNLGSEVSVPLPHLPDAEYDVPPHSVCLIVEGTSGDRGGARSASKLIESVYRLTPDGTAKDAVIMAGGDLDFNLNATDGHVYMSGSHINRADGDLLRLRSKGYIKVRRPQSSVPAEIRVQPGVDVELGHSDFLYASYDADQVTPVPEQVGDGEDFYNLTWDQIPKVEKKRRSRDVIQLPGGVYTYGRAIGSTNPDERELRYYNMRYKAYLNKPESYLNDPDNGVVLQSTSLSEIRAKENRDVKGLKLGPSMLNYWPNGAKKPSKYKGFKFEIKRTELQIVKSGEGKKIEDFVLIPRSPSRVDRGEADPWNDLYPKPPLDDNYDPDHMLMVLDDASITVQGDVVIQGGVSGRGGTLIGGGDITILAGRTLELRSEGRSDEELEKEYEQLMNLYEANASGTFDGSGLDGEVGQNTSLQLNLYCKGNLMLSTYVQDRQAYRNLAFRGLLYSWGNIDIGAGRGDEFKRGNLTLQGAMVAYGENPETSNPGGKGLGNISIRAANANLAWDPRYLPSMRELLPQGETVSFTLQRTGLRELR
jgi:type II secretory pathway pseudopilin PulG